MTGVAALNSVCGFSNHSVGAICPIQLFSFVWFD